MRRVIQIALAGWVAFSMSMAQAFAFPADARVPRSFELAAADSPSAYGSGDADSDGSTGAASTDTRGYQKDDAQSAALSSYLKDRRLPLVGAQVLRDPSSGRLAVVLYGFVATDFGKADATTKAHRFFKNTPVVVDNRVMVNPEIATHPKPSRSSQYATGGDGSGSAPDASAPPADASTSPDASSRPDNQADANADANSMPGVQGYLDQQNQQAQVQQYMAQQNRGAGAGGGLMVSGGMMPLVALLGLLAATSGHGSGFSFGSSNPFGSSNQFGGPGQFGGSNPFGSSPYGAPNGPYPSSPYGGNSGSGFSPYP
ncbi:MAG: hypothetical protein ABSG46_07775 [Candidatus Binataceae bacterium]